MEVENLIDQVHNEVNYFRHSKFNICFFLTLLMIFGCIYGINFGNTHKSSFIPFLLLGICGFCTTLIVYIMKHQLFLKRQQMKIQQFLDNVNIQIWHKRQIHWSVGQKCRFLTLQLDYNTQNGKFFPQVVQGIYQMP